MKVSAYRNSFHASVNAKRDAATNPGAASGRTTLVSACILVAPSISAASSRSSGIDSKKPISVQVTNGTVKVG